MLSPPECALISELLASGESSRESAEMQPDAVVREPLLNSLRQKGFLRPRLKWDPDPRLDSSKISSGYFAKQLSLMVSMECNYACKDCFVFNEAANILPKAQAYMSWGTAEEALKSFFTMRQEASAFNESVVRIFGGEPLLNWSLVENTVTWIRSRHIGCPIYVTTNGSLLDLSRATFLHENEVTLFISLDGVKALNDRIRVDHGSRSTFNRTVDGLSASMQVSKRTHVGLTIHDDEGITRLPEFLNFLNELRPAANHVIVVYLSLLKGLVGETRFRLPEAELARFVAALWVSWIQKHIYLGGRLFHCFRNVFATPEKFDRWCDRGTGIVVYPSGEIRPCSGSSDVIGHLGEFSRILESGGFHAVSRRIGGQIRGCEG